MPFASLIEKAAERGLLVTHHGRRVNGEERIVLLSGRTGGVHQIICEFPGKGVMSSSEVENLHSRFGQAYRARFNHMCLIIQLHPTCSHLSRMAGLRMNIRKLT